MGTATWPSSDMGNTTDDEGPPDDRTALTGWNSMRLICIYQDKWVPTCMLMGSTGVGG